MSDKRSPRRKVRDQPKAASPLKQQATHGESGFTGTVVGRVKVNGRVQSVAIKSERGETRTFAPGDITIHKTDEPAILRNIRTR